MEEERQTVDDIGVAVDTVLVVDFTFVCEVLLPELGVALYASFLTAVGVDRRHCCCVGDVSNGSGEEGN